MSDDEKKMPLPIGIDDFKKLRDGGYYYVDKTELIRDLCVPCVGATMVLMPERFGKSLNLSMIDAFLNIKYKGNHWFDGLKINEYPEMEKERNTHPVIYLNMKGLTKDTEEDFIEAMKNKMSSVYKEFAYLKDSEKVHEMYHKWYLQVEAGEPDYVTLENSLYDLSAMLHKHHGIEPVILIDDWEQPLNESCHKDSYKDIKDFLHLFYSQALKSNKHCSCCIVTGVMAIVLDMMTSGLNHFWVYDPSYYQNRGRYGFTGSEVRNLCTYYGHPEKFEEAEEWYGGYHCSDILASNPYSVIHYIDQGFVPRQYCIGKEWTGMIDAYLRDTNRYAWDYLYRLGNGDREYESLSHAVERNDFYTKRGHTISILLSMGLFTAFRPADDDMGYDDILIPNCELYSFFYDRVKDILFRDKKDVYAEFFDALERDDIDNIGKTLCTLFSKKYSFPTHYWDKNYRKNIALISLGRKGRYHFDFDSDSRKRVIDIVMKSRCARYPNIVIEIKRSRAQKESTAESQAANALEQIGQKKCCEGLKGKTVLYGICYYAQKAVIHSEMKTL